MPEQARPIHTFRCRKWSFTWLLIYGCWGRVQKFDKSKRATSWAVVLLCYGFGLKSPASRKEPPLDIILESKVESADRAESLISELSQRQFSEKECHDISLAVREAVVNAVLHGNQFDHRKKIFLSAELRPAGLVISIKDEGNGCEPESVPDPLAADNLMRESGRGMLLIRACMDEVTWRKAFFGGTELIMTKRYSTDAQRGASAAADPF